MILFCTWKKCRRIYVFLALSVLLSCSGNANELSEVDRVISAYYSIPAYADSLLLSRKLSEKQFKDKLKEKISEICTDPLLGRFQKWIDETSIQSGAFNEMFYSLTLMEAKKMINVSRDNPRAVKATYRIKTKNAYGLANNLSGLNNFVSKFKVTNMSQAELEKLVNGSRVPDVAVIEVTGTYDVMFTLVTVNGRLKVSDENEQLVSSTIVVHTN